MATLAQLEAAIDGLLQHPAGGGRFRLQRRVEPKAYEAYIFGLSLRAIRDLGATPVLTGITDPPDPFVFRGAPGQIYSRAKNYGYASFALQGQDFEVHAGVEFRGTSGMTHELDVCVMRASEAQACRLGPRDPDANALVAAFECKFYAGSLDKSQARSFLGLMDDMGTNARHSGLCSNLDHAQVRQYLRPLRRPHPYLHLTPLDSKQESLFVGGLANALNKLAG